MKKLFPYGENGQADDSLDFCTDDLRKEVFNRKKLGPGINAVTDKYNSDQKMKHKYRKLQRSQSPGVCEFVMIG